MPQTKNPHLRYRLLDLMLRNTGRTFTFKELLDSLNESLEARGQKTVSIRQLRADLEYMRSEAGFSAPIEVKKGSNPPLYQYADTKFQIGNNPMNPQEAAQLRDTLQMLERFDGSPQFAWLQEMSPRIREAFDLEKRANPIISFHSNIDYTGYEFIAPIFDAISNQRVLQLNYKPFHKAAWDYRFHPYYLKQYNQRWFAAGYNETQGKDTWIVPLDRIVSLAQIQTEYRRSSIDWEDYFEQVIGVTVPEGHKGIFRWKGYGLAIFSLPLP